MESKIGKAIKIMCLAKRHFNSGQNWRAYRIFDWTCKRYGIEYPEAHYLQIDIINGFISA